MTKIITRKRFDRLIKLFDRFRGKSGRPLPYSLDRKLMLELQNNLEYSGIRFNSFYNDVLYGGIYYTDNITNEAKIYLNNEFNIIDLDKTCGHKKIS